jgi:hypothetical protein
LPPAALSELVNLARAIIPDPRKELADALAGLDPTAQAQAFAEQAPFLRPWPPSIFDIGTYQDVLLSAEGMALVVFWSHRRTHPGFTREQAREIAETVTLAEFTTLIGLVIDKPEGGKADPKAPADAPKRASRR